MDTDSDIESETYNLRILSERLIKLRKENKLSQNTVSYITNFPRSTIAAWERGERVPNVDEIKNIALFYDVSVGYLLGFKDKKM